MKTVDLSLFSPSWLFNTLSPNITNSRYVSKAGRETAEGGLSILLYGGFAGCRTC
jgi:hypothetical protein